MADALAALGGLLAQRLTDVTSLTTADADRMACAEAADAARTINDLLASDEHDTDARR